MWKNLTPSRNFKPKMVYFSDKVIYIIYNVDYTVVF